MAYKITSYTFNKARKLNVKVKPSTSKLKKIDVFKKGVKIASIGAKGYPDYPTLKKTKGKQFAETRRKLYKARHINNRLIKYSAGWYADQLLW